MEIRYRASGKWPDHFPSGRTYTGPEAAMIIDGGGGRAATIDGPEAGTGDYTVRECLPGSGERLRDRDWTTSRPGEDNRARKQP